MLRQSYFNWFTSGWKARNADMTFLSKFSLYHEDDQTQECKAVNIVVLQVGAIVVTDINNALTKAFRMDGTFLDSVADANARPFGLAVTGTNGFAVSLNGQTNTGDKIKKIAFYKLIDDKIERVDIIDTPKRYMGLAILPHDQLICGTKNAIHLMTSKGENVRNMSSEMDLVNPYHIRVTSSGKVVVADSEKVCIVVYNERGTLEKHVHLGKLFLRGISITDDVIFFVHQKEDYVSVISMKENHVTSINPDREKLCEPQAIFVCPDGKAVVAEKEMVKLFRIENYEQFSFLANIHKLKRFILLLAWNQLTETVGFFGILEIATALCMRNL